MRRWLRWDMLPLPFNLVSRHLVVSSLPSLPPAPLPSRREAHLWYIVPNELEDASLLQDYRELLSPCEKENVLSIKGEALKKCAILSRVLVRTTLSRYTDCKVNPRLFKFRKNRFGKPEVEHQNGGLWVPPSLQFNISHTSSMIACGVTVDVPIGIDIEEKRRKPVNNLLSLAHRYFSPYEVQYLASFMDPENRQSEFLRLWTLKEAYVKALGRGFSGAPFRDFTIRFEKSTDSVVPERPKSEEFRIMIDTASDSENLTANWQFALVELSGSHLAAICMEKDENMPGTEQEFLKLKVWKTLPFVEDKCMSETDAVINISGLS
ncbi:4'-phosphopantetheinyl transferase superfamily [Musa troglodytarum]|uniref:holo-[acyl-carrier-protein] synthase n=1 Tax=Musa troglodytarum TaxID=320322 RepID=A0A9E7FS17_9LILI|nr:4'-phosphopantetheinyl transferase superfamily [Musa troglodytarum]